MSASFRTIPLLQPVVFAVLLHVLWAASQDAKVRAPNINWTSAAALPQCTADWSTIVVDTAAAPILTSPCNISRLFPDVYPDGTKPRYDPADDSTLWYKIEKGSVPNGQRMVLWFDMKRNTGSFGILVMSDPTEGCKQMYVGGFFRGCWHCDYSNRIWTDHVAFMVNSSVTYYIAISSTPPSSNLKISCKAPYPNTDFRKAKTLTCNGSTHGSTVGATGIGDDPPCLVSVIDETRHTGETRLLVQRRGLVWFKLPPEQPPSKVHLTLKSRRHTTSMMVFVAGSKRRWDECATVVVQQYEQLTEVNFSTDGNSTYYVAVFEEDRGVRNEGLVWENEGGFDLHTTCSVTQHPVNDDWTNATSIKCNSSIAIDTNGATRDETYPCAFKGPRPKDGNFVWFKIQPSQVARKKVVQIDVHGKEEQLLIFGRRESEQVDDECTLYMSSLRGEDFTGKIEFAIDGVSTYYVAGAFSQFDVTGVALKIKCLDGVPNDSFEDAQPITCGSVVSGDLRGATWEWSPLGYSTTPLNNFPCVRSPSVFADICCDLQYVWYIWDSSKAPSGSRVSAEVTGVLSSENLGMESVVLVQAEMGQWGGACQFDAPFPIHGDGKSSYHIGVKSVYQLNTEEMTAYTLELICENDAPRNFDFHHAIPLSCNKTASGTTKGFLTNMKNQLPCKLKNKAFPATGMVWFVVTGIDAPDSSAIEIKLSGSSPSNLRLVVFGARKSGTPNDRCKKEDTEGLDKVVIHPSGNAVYYVGVYKQEEEDGYDDETPAPTGTDFTLDVSCFIKEWEDPHYDYQTAAPIRCTSPPTRIQTSTNSVPLSTLPCNGTSKYFNHTHILWYKLQKDSVHQGQRVVVELEYRKPKGADYPEKFGLVVLRGQPSCTVVALHGCNSKGCVGEPGVGNNLLDERYKSLGQIVFTPDHDDDSEYYIAVSRRWATTTRALTLTCQDVPNNFDYNKAIPVQCNKEISGTTAGSAGAEHKMPCDTNGNFDTRPNDRGVWFILQRDSTPTIFDVNITVKGSTQSPRVQVFGAKDKNGGEDKCWMMSESDHEYEYDDEDGYKGELISIEYKNFAVFQHDPSMLEFIHVYERGSRAVGGPFTLQVTCGGKVQPAPNDHYKSALPIDCSTNKTVDLRNATFDTELPCEVDASLLPSYRYKFLWYKFPDGQPTRQKVVRMQFGQWQAADHVNAIVLGRKADKSSSSKCTFVKLYRITAEISFRSDGVSTYFIGVSQYLVESQYPVDDLVVPMKSTCLDATVNDNFEDALPITCNTTLNGTLKGASEDTIYLHVDVDGNLYYSGYSLTATNNAPCTFVYPLGPKVHIWYKFDGATTPVDLVITASQSGLLNAQVNVLVPKDPKQVNGECLYESSSPFSSDGSSTYYIGMGFDLYWWWDWDDFEKNGQPFSVTLTC